MADRRHGRHHPRHHHHHEGRHGERRNGRPFDYGELRILSLALLAEQPRHGYELFKVIEERMGGSYSPSPGVIYPTLTWLEDMGYAEVEADVSSGRKRYRITKDGESFLAANRSAAEDLASRVASTEGRGASQMPASVVRGMENVKLALRLRIKQGPISAEAAEGIAAALDAASKTIERS